jgi:hypothetical protein
MNGRLNNDTVKPAVKNNRTETLAGVLVTTTLGSPRVQPSCRDKTG